MKMSVKAWQSDYARLQLQNYMVCQGITTLVIIFSVVDPDPVRSENFHGSVSGITLL